MCGLARAYIRAKFPQSYQECWLIFSRWPTWPHILIVGFPDFCWLLSPVNCRVLSTSLFCLLLCPLLFWDLPSLVLFWSRGKSHAQSLCVGFAPKETKESSDWHLPTPTSTQRMPTSCHSIQNIFWNYVCLWRIIVINPWKPYNYG